MQVKVGEELARAKDEASEAARLLWDLLTTWGLRLIGVVTLMCLTWMAAAWARRIVYKTFNRPHFDQTLVRFFSTTTKWAIVALGLVACLSVFGINTTGLAAVLGATGLAVGLALQGSLSNLAAGVLLLILRPFKVGDLVNIAGQVGTVDEIELFHTQIDTPDNRRVILPNSQIFGTMIENLTHHARRRVDIPVGVLYSADVEATRRALAKAAADVPGALSDPAPEIVLLEIAPAMVKWQVRVWAAAADHGAVFHAGAVAIKGELDRAGLVNALQPVPAPIS